MTDEQSKEICYLLERRSILYDDLGLTSRRLRELNFEEKKDKDFPVSSIISISRREFNSCRDIDDATKLVTERAKVAISSLINELQVDFEKRGGSNFNKVIERANT